MKKILVIDDNEDVLYALKEVMLYKNWIPYTADSVQMGVNIFRSEAIDLVLIDYHMPVEDGMLGVQKLRALSASVPIIVLTVDENQSIADAFINKGASDFALKPIKAPDLLSRLSVHLAMAGEKNTSKCVKGISPSTLIIIEEYMKKTEGEMTASQISEETALAYQTVHRYLRYLVEEKRVGIELRYGKVGRPTQYYVWL